MPIYSVRFRFRPEDRSNGEPNTGKDRIHKFGKVRFTADDDNDAYDRAQKLMEQRHEIWERYRIWVVRVEPPERMVLR